MTYNMLNKLNQLSPRQRLFVFSLWFNGFWLSCVFGTFTLQLMLLLVGVVLSTQVKSDYKLSVVALVLGLLCDFSLYNLGIHQFAYAGFPVWLVLLWCGFSLYVGAIHQQLSAVNPVILWLVVGIVTPLNYVYGVFIGKLLWPLGIGITYIIMLCTWLAYTVCLMAIRYHLPTKYSYVLAICIAIMSLFMTPPLVKANQAMHYSVSADQQANQDPQGSLPWDDWVLMGRAQLTWVFWNVYQSSLYTPTGEYQQAGPLALSIDYQLDIKREDLLKATDEQWQHLKIDKVSRQTWLTQLAEIWPDITKGDNLTYVLQAGRGVFYFNQSRIGQLDDTQLAEAFVAIWLAPQTAYPKLRKQLLSGNQ